MVIKFDEVPVLNLPGRNLRLILDPKQSKSGTNTVIITEIPSGCELPVHKHDIGEEIMYFATGMAETLCDGESIRVQPGDTFKVPEGSVHTVRNVGGETVRMFCVFNPPIDTSSFKVSAER